jgi:DNA-binding NarL/FixJ family response regulator
VNILIIDDHALIREGLRHVLQEIDRDGTVIEADSSETALAALMSHGSNLTLILLDLGLPGTVGMNLLRQIREAQPGVPVVVVSANDDRAVVLEAIDAGAMGFISKRSSSNVLVNGVRLVLAGGICIPPHAQFAAQERPSASAPEPVDATLRRTPSELGITARQTDVLALLIQGKPTKFICRELDLSVGTVKTHIAAIFRALNVSNRTQAVFALSNTGIQLPMTVKSGAGSGAVQRCESA